MRNKTVPLYLFFIGAACLILIVPVIAAQLIDRFMYSNEPNYLDHPTEWVESVLLDVDHWGTAHWKEELDKRLSAYDLQVLVLSSDQAPLYQYMAENRDLPTETFTEPVYKTNLFQDGEWLGSVYLSSIQPRVLSASSSSDSAILKYLFALIALILLVFLYFIRHQIVKPMHSLIQASEKVAGGNYHVQLAPSKIKELREVSESYREMSISLAELERQRAEHEADRNFLISSIVHDLRTPLFSIKGYLEGIVQGIASTKEQKDKYLHRSIKLAHRLERLISMLSKYNESYLSAKQLKLESLYITKLMDGVISDLQFQIEQKQITVIKKYAVSKKLKMDHHLMYRALENVISNAIRFSPEKGQIEVEIRPNDTGTIQIAIRDEGPGFLEHELHEIFKPLYQADKSRGSEHPGIGLGLAISKTIIESHGGKIMAYNNPKKGASLIIELN